MNFKELRAASGMTQKAFAEYFEIPKRTVENWETERNKCPEYLLNLMEYKLKRSKEKMSIWKYISVIEFNEIVRIISNEKTIYFGTVSNMLRELDEKNILESDVIKLYRDSESICIEISEIK